MAQSTGLKMNSRLAKPGQFASQLPVVRLTGNTTKAISQPTVRLTGNTKPQFKSSNGSNAIAGARGQFGAMLPRVGAGTSPAAGVGQFSVSKLNTVTKVVANAMSGISKLGGTAGLAQQMGYARQPLSGVNPTIGRQATVQRGTFAGTDPRQIPSGFNRPVVKLTGQPNTVGVNQYNYLTPQQKSAWDAEKRRQQINQLTAPYTGSLAALTGANMVEPVNQGFPGTDPRQQVQVSNQYLAGPQRFGAPIQGVPWNSFGNTTGNYGTASTAGANTAGGRRGGGYGGGYGNPYGYNDQYGYSPYSGGGSYGSTPYSSWGDPVGNILNWRVATG